MVSNATTHSKRCQEPIKSVPDTFCSPLFGARLTVPFDFELLTATLDANTDRGGTLTENGLEEWNFTPNHTYDQNAPWDPSDPFGRRSGQPAAAGASVRGTARNRDDSDETFRFVVKFKPAEDAHGYTYYYKGNVSDKTATSQGGLLVSGGEYYAELYAWLAQQAGGGDRRKTTLREPISIPRKEQLFSVRPFVVDGK